MTIWKHGNYAFKEPSFQDGDTVEDGNYCQLQPNTEICKNIKNIIINGGNFVNVKPQSAWTINGGNWVQKEFCTHQHPNFINRGLTPCAENCSHRQGENKQWVDIDEKEYIQIKEEELKANTLVSSVKIEKTVDLNEITQQKFQKEIYIYEDIVIKKGSSVKKALLSAQITESN